MVYSEEWKSFFPIHSGKYTPLLLSISSPSAKSIFGPLFFNPIPHTLTPLASSPSLSPPLLTPPPSILLPRFLTVASDPDPSVPYSTASSIASYLAPHRPLEDSASFLTNNRLQFLRIAGADDAVLVFFPSGSDYDQVGFSLLRVKDGKLAAVGKGKDRVFTANKKLGQRIVKILVQPVKDLGCYGGQSNSDSSYGYFTVGWLMAVTMYALHWFRVKIGGMDERPALNYMGCKRFKSGVAGACWNPHMPEQSVALLENGSLFLFDFHDYGSDLDFTGTLLKVLWDNSYNLEPSKWLGCEFSWHPGILIAVRSDAAFLVDWRYGECEVTCLARIDMFHVYVPAGKEEFLAFSKAVSDDFHFVLASNSMLVLCDVRKPMVPVLRWLHRLVDPCYVDVFRLSDLRANLRDNRHQWANESGFGIILGSFWNSEFSLFCYGPLPPTLDGSLASEISKFSKSMYSWGLSSSLSLSAPECQCGSCLMRGEFWKAALPEWIEWQQKKEIVLGFGVLGDGLSSLLFKPDEFGGFVMVRLLSSGKLESQRYCASWDLVRKPEIVHVCPSLHSEDNLLSSGVDEKYKFRREFNYFKLDYLSAYLSNNLFQLVTSRMPKSPLNSSQGNEFFSIEFHEMLCKQLKMCGFSRYRTDPAIRVVFNDINLPTSVYEVALRNIWANLPMELLQLAFTNNNEVIDVLSQKEAFAGFLMVPDMPQLPPFLLRKPSNSSNEWYSKVQQSDVPVGPVLPLPILITLHELRNACPESQEEAVFSPEMELNKQCNDVRQLAKEMAVADYMNEFDEEEAVSLADDRDDVWVDSDKQKPFMLYHPAAFQCSTEGHGEESQCLNKDDRFSAVISKVLEKEPAAAGTPKAQEEVKKEPEGSDGLKSLSLDFFDELCPIDLKLPKDVKECDKEELDAYEELKQEFSDWQEGFAGYQEFCTKFRFPKQGA